MFPAVVVEELSRFSTPEGLNEAVTLSSGVSDAPGPPMSVLTQPGLLRTQATPPRGAKSIAALRITMFTAAFELR